MIRTIMWAAVAATLMAGGANARTPDPLPSSRLDGLFACGMQTSPEMRVRCYDAAVAELRQAVAKRDVLVSDKAQVRETRRSLFGLTLPRLAILGDDDGPDQVESTLQRASTGPDGRFVFTLANGATWHQTDDNPIPRTPRTGDAVVVKRAALGSFKLSVRDQPAVRVRRQN